ncbi:MAG: restriction endonuclease [Chloroflexi bacterium]|nr:restriction endonuclease [Ardenticatenaceae bacterium]MBL1129188.1 restriction endonuclease [Chloroflexota bacterium]NOG35264.1 restriction endonuclease [Chloroflexota bacterium]GIK58449.1 MAG: hypothetical protein BroJett015_41120 [Chloroflexota bacterium]
MNKFEFLAALQNEAGYFNDAVATHQGDWVVKGFIDVARNIYTISTDTKVVSKIMELLLFPRLVQFANKYHLKLHLVQYQNFYPDITFVDSDDHLFALDLKTTYRINANRVNGMTLGAFTGYFRNRASTKNVAFPYGRYTGHYVLGVIYSQVSGIDERQVHRLEHLESITSVITDFQFFAQEKYRIASDRPSSGNTKNIGSVTEIDKLISGTGPFASLGEELFDDYWMYYLTNDMARAVELPKRPYTNLKTYVAYKCLTT